MEDKRNKLWLSKIKTNIKQQYKNKQISEKYTLKDFCNDFIGHKNEIYYSIARQCICGHDIKRNYLYKNKYNNDVIILGSCCIKTFSTEYEKERKCFDCGIKIKKNKNNQCKECIEKDKEREKYICECGKNKKPEYKKCFLCKKKYLKNNF